MAIPASLRTIRDEHMALAAMLRSLQQLVRQAPVEPDERFFDTVQAMLFYIDEFPERLHHPKESNLLFPRVARAAPEAMAAIERLEQDHIQGEVAVRALQHQLLAWKFLGAARRQSFVQALDRYVGFYLEHMRTEETEILPVAERCLGAADWAALDEAFAANQDPLTRQHAPAPLYERLFQRILHDAPAPIGLGG
ncbi:hemerythrin domain-containing protein [Aquabacterium sp. A08]|uniref:hemerythrin domain-containing protein n=1 Tax=Aquabacterium sp. A08 TaxID=2718532 RepID=UPI00141F3F73|nr:hemerythrin domain-containing protein [Aquabacterium sp. A08]NIC41263.1 hemerythrin domain-containing protein [Aquabacterium sp. A08]NIC43702.1 hemerythrin domain-containing protein [Aquabacterium sp. A08]